jgi:hypothetical protein
MPLAGFESTIPASERHNLEDPNFQVPVLNVTFLQLKGLGPLRSVIGRFHCSFIQPARKTRFLLF